MMDDVTGSLVSIATTTLVAASGLASYSGTALPTPSSDLHTLYYHGVSPADQGRDPNGEDGGECKLLGPFSVFVQVALGGLALLSLVFKRWRERPQRPIKVWAFDVSKQVFGSVMLHMLNLLLSMFSAGQLEIRNAYKPNPCSFYLLNLGIDVSLDILLSLLFKNRWLTDCDELDYPRYPHPDPHPPCSKLPSVLYNSCQPPRIDRVRKLWPASTCDVVVQAGHHILRGINQHEDLRFLPYSAPAFHRQDRRLGSTMDRR
jgi:hypothetical protein